MATLRLQPNDGPTLAEGFDLVGSGDITGLVLSPGLYGANQGVYSTRADAAPVGVTYDLVFEEGAVIDLGGTSWADIFVPGTQFYRTMRFGSGWHISGPGVVTGTGAMTMMHGGTLTVLDVTFTTPHAYGLQEVAQSPGRVLIRNCTFSGIGLDPVPSDPIWTVIGRVPVGLTLTAGGMTYDIHQAVADVGLTHRIVYAENPDINDSTHYNPEKTQMYFLCKQFGYKGAGKHALYFEGEQDIHVENCRFVNVSGYGVFINPLNASDETRGVTLTGNRFDGCTAAYSTWGKTPEMQVSGNDVTVRYRDNGPRWHAGFVLNGSPPPTHEGNRWEYHNDSGVYAYRLWNDSPRPDLSGDAVFSDDGEAVPVYGGGYLPAEPLEPPDPPVEPPEPEPQECPCAEEIAALTATVEALRDDVASLSIQLAAIHERQDRPYSVTSVWTAQPEG